MTVSHPAGFNSDLSHDPSSSTNQDSVHSSAALNLSSDVISYPEEKAFHHHLKNDNDTSYTHEDNVPPTPAENNNAPPPAKNNVPDITMNPSAPSSKDMFSSSSTTSYSVDDNNTFIYHPSMGTPYTLDDFLYPTHSTFGEDILNATLASVLLTLIIFQIFCSILNTLIRTCGILCSLFFEVMSSHFSIIIFTVTAVFLDTIYIVCEVINLSPLPTIMPRRVRN